MCWFIISKVTALRVVLLISLSLFGCSSSDQAEDAFDRYRYRLSNALDVSLEKPVYNSLPTFPAPRELTQVVESLDINLLKFLQLSTCDLQRHIGYRNSGLGRVMTETQQFIYEVRFLILAQECLDYMRSTQPKSSLLKELTRVMQLKQQQLALRMWNATFGGREFRKLFSLSGKNQVANQSTVLLDTFNQLNFSLTQFLALANRDHTTLTQEQKTALTQQLDHFEQHYAVIETESHYLGELLHKIHRTQVQIHIANRGLSQRLEQGPICFQPKPNRQAKVLWTVFQQFFIGEVQPYIATLIRHKKEILQIMDQWLTLLKKDQAVPESFIQYWRQTFSPSAKTSYWFKMQAEFEQHIQLWQTLLSQCGLRPVVLP